MYIRLAAQAFRNLHTISCEISFTQLLLRNHSCTQLRHTCTYTLTHTYMKHFLQWFVPHAAVVAKTDSRISYLLLQPNLKRLVELQCSFAFARGRPCARAECVRRRCDSSEARGAATTSTVRRRARAKLPAQKCQSSRSKGRLTARAERGPLQQS